MSRSTHVDDDPEFAPLGTGSPAKPADGRFNDGTVDMIPDPLLRDATPTAGDMPDGMARIDAVPMTPRGDA